MNKYTFYFRKCMHICVAKDSTFEVCRNEAMGIYICMFCLGTIRIPEECITCYERLKKSKNQ